MSFFARSLFVSLIATAGFSMGCSTPAVVRDASTTDAPADRAITDAVTSDTTGRDVGTGTDAQTGNDANTGTDATTQDDASSSMDVAQSTDASSSMDVVLGMDAMNTRDVPVIGMDAVTRDVVAAGCTLPLGGTCAPGATCPAGDGCNTCFCPARGGNAICTTRPCAADAGQDTGIGSDAAAGQCRQDSDCHLFSSYCATAPCQCIALGPGERDPRCNGGMVTCFVPPCRNRTAACVGGSCVVQ